VATHVQVIKAIIKDLAQNPKTRCQCDTGWVWVLERLSEAHRKGQTPHTDMMDTGGSSAIGETEGNDPHASKLKE
jgi:type II secretory pathway predicted ATPase ExeA